MKPVHPVTPRPRWPFTRRQIVGQIIVAAVILASGIGIGVGGTILSLKDRMVRPPVGDPRPPGPPDELIGRWRVDLSLTDEQVQQIKDMFTKHLAAAREQWVKMMELQRQEREEFVASMKSILTPDQFTKWYKEFTEHVGHWRPRGPGGPGGPDRRGRPDHQGGPNKPGGPDGHRDRGFRDMKAPEAPPNGTPGDLPPDNPPPQ